MSVDMFRIAGQTAEPIGLHFFVDTHGWPGGVIVKRKHLINTPVTQANEKDTLLSK